MPFISDEEAETWHNNHGTPTTAQVVASAEESRKLFFDLINSIVSSPASDDVPSVDIIEGAANLTKLAQERAKQEGWV